MSSDCDCQVINKQSEQQGGVVKQQSSEQQFRKQDNEQQQQQHDGQQAAAALGSSHTDQQQLVGSSSKASGSNGEVRVLDAYSSKDMTICGYVNKDGSTYSKDLLDLCTSVTPPPPASQPQSTTAATTMVQVTLCNITTMLNFLQKFSIRV